jgi:hypothetical protein
VKYAEAYGCKGHEVTAIEQFIPTLEAAFNEGGVHLVSVPVDYSENQRVLVDELRQAFPGNGRGQQVGGVRPVGVDLGRHAAPTKVGGYRAAGAGAGRFWYAGQPAVPGAASPSLHDSRRSMSEATDTPRRRKQVDRRAP